MLKGANRERHHIIGKDVPREVHHLEEINSDTIDEILNDSKYFQHNYKGSDDPLRKLNETNIKLLQEIASLIRHQSQSFKRNLQLRIKLYDGEGLTSRRVKYLDLVSGTGENVMECYRKEDVTVKYVNREGKLPEISSFGYIVPEISVLYINQILNASEFLESEDDRRMLQEVSSRVAKEPLWKRKNCELTVILHNINGHLHNRVKHIVIAAGEKEHKIQCSKSTKEEIHWECEESLNLDDAQKETYECEMITTDEINKILEQSKFLKENRSHRQFVSSDVRRAIPAEWETVRKNCTLTIELAPDEGAANIPMKHIVIKAGNGENTIRSSKDNPWHIRNQTSGAAFVHGVSTAYNNTTSGIFSVGARFANYITGTAMQALGYT
ncbi:uncharacterized protein LOC110446459 isoform X2 [Mizuhopecten yessoensis]|uniref:uncharacterized protein LOC110446459 isoform X2 n=1 Tax=Mizuhopecten yessoensis TaxID=6573 RepID=UPI000B45BB6E|nr:uncharacterized protein LOC110446459 isoform X2 [Mizuhopecten yessoensis]